MPRRRLDLYVLNKIGTITGSRFQASDDFLWREGAVQLFFEFFFEDIPLGLGGLPGVFPEEAGILTGIGQCGEGSSLSEQELHRKRAIKA
jgi:hypothetical protein